jgi:hypothetical protein
MHLILTTLKLFFFFSLFYQIFGESEAKLRRALQVRLHPNAAVNLAFENRAVGVEQHRDALDQIHKDLVLGSFLGLNNKNQQTSEAKTKQNTNNNLWVPCNRLVCVA